MSTITTTFDAGVLTLTLDRPEQGNAINMALASDLLDAALAAAGDPAVRCVVITGAGRMFCVGGDVSGFAAAGDEAAAFIKGLADKLHEAVLVLANMAKPLVALSTARRPGQGSALRLLPTSCWPAKLRISPRLIRPSDSRRMAACRGCCRGWSACGRRRSLFLPTAV